MRGMIAVSPGDCNTARETVRRSADATTVRRATVLLLTAAGRSVRFIARVLFCSFDLIAAVRRGYRHGGVRRALGLPERTVTTLPWWYTPLLQWALERTPAEFDFRRSRWSCGALAAALWDRHRLRRGRETVRRALRELGLVWRRPRPVVGPSDPDHTQKMQALRARLTDLPANQVVVYQDEVQLDLNPKIGSAWMLQGHQAEVVTPGDNVRRHLAVSMVAPTGKLVVSEPTARRNSAQFVAHLGDLCSRLRRWKVIHVVCDNATFHKSKAVRRWVAGKRGRVVLHYLPTRAPEENPVERVFWRLHEAVTRNHQFATIEELMVAAHNWLHHEGRADPHQIQV